MEYQYPILKKVFTHYKGTYDLRESYLICCQHFLEPQLKMFEYLIKFGFKPEKIVVLAKAYSYNKEVADSLSELGIKVLYFPFSGIAFDEEHRNNVKKLLEEFPPTSASIILDDGAEIIKKCNDSNQQIKFAVEQTSSGFRKIENDDINFPVVNVARSNTKLNKESLIIADIIYNRIIEYLNIKNISNPSFLIVGQGPIGKSLLDILKRINIKCEGFDIKHGHKDLVNKILTLSPNVVVGATGSNILNEGDIRNLINNKPLFLISASSSDREFAVTNFRHHNQVHQDVTYQNITFVNGGFPITFKGNRIESSAEEMEKTISLLGGSIMHGIVHLYLTNGLVEVPTELEKIINE